MSLLADVTPWIDPAVIVLYFASVIGIGFWYQRRAARDLDSYFLGGHSMHWLGLAMSGSVSNFDMTGTMWIVTLLYLFGMKSMWNHWMWGFLMGAFFAENGRGGPPSATATPDAAAVSGAMEPATTPQAVVSLDAERVMPAVLKRFLAPGLRGLVIAGLLAAFMSTFSATVNSAAPYIVRDLWQPLFGQGATAKQLVRASSIATLLVVVAGTLIGLTVASIGQIFSWIMMELGAAFVLPNVLRWYWWRFNGWGYAVGTLTGLAAAIAVPCLPTTWPPLRDISRDLCMFRPREFRGHCAGAANGRSDAAGLLSASAAFWLVEPDPSTMRAFSVRAGLPGGTSRLGGCQCYSGRNGDSRRLSGPKVSGRPLALLSGGLGDGDCRRLRGRAMDVVP